MAGKRSLGSLADRIGSLLANREEHQAAIEQIDSTLAKIQSVLGGGSIAVPTGAKPGAKRGPKPRRKRGSFAMSGDESILAFIKSAGTPTTKDVNKHWKGEGRGGSADNALTKLVKTKKLKRMSIKGERGSKYSIA